MSELNEYPEILTKEKFWNDLQEKYPEQMKVFCEWIDGYKERNNWPSFFNHTKEDCPKFHDLPTAMQIGIIMEFSMDHEDHSKELKIDVVKSIETLITGIKV